MKKYLLTLALFIAFIGTSLAQKISAEDKAKKVTEKMEKDLALNADQKIKVFDASLEKIKAQDVLKAAAGEGVKPDQEQMKAINQKFNKVLKETLNDEQKAKMAEMKAQQGDGNAPKKTN